MRIIYAIIIGGLVCMESGCTDKKDDKGVGGAGGDGSGGAALGGGGALAADGGRTAPVVGGVGNLSPDVGKSRAEKIAEAKAAMDAAKMRLDNNADNLIPVNADLKAKRIALIDRLVGPPGLFTGPENVGYLVDIVGLPIDRSGTTAQSIQAYRNSIVEAVDGNRRRDHRLDSGQFNRVQELVHRLNLEICPTNSKTLRPLFEAISAANPALPQQTIDEATALQAQLETYSENFHDPAYMDQCRNLLNNLLSHIGENPPASIQAQVQTFKDKLREQTESRQRHTDREKGALLRALGVDENVAALLASIARYRSTIGATGVTEAQTETARHELIKVVESNHAALVENGGAAFKEWNEYKAAKSLVDNLQPAKVQADYEAKKAQYDTLVAAAASS